MNERTINHIDAGRIPSADRVQRLHIGGGLMLLTVIGLMERFEWRAVIALTLQTELLLTGLVGWCPIYWTCRVTMNESPRTLNNDSEGKEK